jgi:hypothetical protein
VYASASSRGYAQLAIDLLARCAPAHHAELVAGLRAIPGTYRIGAETFAIAVRDGAVTFDEELPSGTVVNVTIDPCDLVRLVDGTISFEALLAQERLRIFGAPDALLALSRAVAALLEGTLHQRALRDLFEDYRRWAAAAAVSSRLPSRERRTRL